VCGGLEFHIGFTKKSNSQSQYAHLRRGSIHSLSAAAVVYDDVGNPLNSGFEVLYCNGSFAFRRE